MASLLSPPAFTEKKYTGNFHKALQAQLKRDTVARPLGSGLVGTTTAIPHTPDPYSFFLIRRVFVLLPGLWLTGRNINVRDPGGLCATDHGVGRDQETQIKNEEY